jgi:hypothetical protein
MKIASTRRFSRLNDSSSKQPEKAQKKQPEPPPGDGESFLASLPLNEATVEIPEVLLGLSGLQDSTPMLGNGLRVGVGAIALAKSLQAFTTIDGPLGKLEGLSALGLTVAAGASVFHGNSAHLVGMSAEGVHGLCEVAIGANEIREGLQDGGGTLLTSGILGTTKGLTTFLPMVAPGTGTAVGLLHLGILVTKTAIHHTSTQKLMSF